jgi:hypothetical protein
MCRSIKVLRVPGSEATREDLDKAALQFVRKISGFHKPSKANQEVFERAVREIADAGERLLGGLAVKQDREGAGLSGRARPQRDVPCAEI